MRSKCYKIHRVSMSRSITFVTIHQHIYKKSNFQRSNLKNSQYYSIDISIHKNLFFTVIQPFKFETSFRNNVYVLGFCSVGPKVSFPKRKEKKNGYFCLYLYFTNVLIFKCLFSFFY